jgi:hypothetical protein
MTAGALLTVYLCSVLVRETPPSEGERDTRVAN